jgi:hypothetical protein
MIGWFVLTGPGAQPAATRDERLLGRTVRDVMTCPPAAAPSWWSVSDFLVHLGRAHPGDQVFALVDLDGQAKGVLRIRDLTQVRPDRRVTTLLGEVSYGTRPLTVQPDTPLIDVGQTIPVHGGIAVVVEDDWLIATVAVRDIEAAATAATSARPTEPAAPVNRPPS